MFDSDAEVSKDDRTMALLAHLSVLVMPVIIPVILWAIKKDESPFVAYHAMQALVYQLITTTVVFFIIFFVMLITMGLCFPIVFVGFLPAIGGILYGLKANEGQWVGYPLIEGIGR
ncbi:MAG: DUF4870 domain-containing protein [Deltaproteobacteria bacterium]|nr:DUF4870 domain-containing protein [Deltaproteobacteria bacterium]